MIDIELPSQLMHNYFPVNAFAMPQVSSVMQCSAFPAGVPHASLCRDKLRAPRFSMLSMLSCGVVVMDDAQWAGCKKRSHIFAASC